VVEHRAMKERQRLKAEQEERERRAITLVCGGREGIGESPCLPQCVVSLKVMLLLQYRSSFQSSHLIGLFWSCDLALTQWLG